MFIYLWDACHFHGVTDDAGRAREAAAACIVGGFASGARVESALLVSGFAHITYGYERTGQGWQGQGKDGHVTWRRFASQVAS